jgi:hypothetical protein
MELFDGWYTIPPGWLGPQENVFVVHAAGASTQDPFLGYWRSIDPGDGSTQWLTITGGGEDDIYYLAYKDDYASVCGGPNGAGSASGTIEPGTGYLHATGTYHCFDGSFSTEFSFRLKPIDANTLMEIGGSYPAVWHRVGS